MYRMTVKDFIDAEKSGVISPAFKAEFPELHICAERGRLVIDGTECKCLEPADNTSEDILNRVQQT